MKMRHEIKHYINQSDYLAIKNRLRHIAEIDPNANEKGVYKIRSIYFEDHNDRVLREKLSGINKRDKFRIRLYNEDDSFIRLEKKSKINSLCQKISSRITKAECKQLFAGQLDFLKNSKEHLFNELYVRMTSERWKPKTIVDYVREAYLFAPGNVRITFDRSVKTGLSCTAIFDNDLPVLETIDPGYIILEVKYDEFLPEIIADMIQVGERRRLSVSKYVLCRMYY